MPFVTTRSSAFISSFTPVLHPQSLQSTSFVSPITMAPSRSPVPVPTHSPVRAVATPDLALTPTQTQTSTTTISSPKDAVSNLRSILSLDTPLARYVALLNLLERDPVLFFCLAQANLSATLPVVYTPTVGSACVNYPSLDLSHRRGLWLNISSHKGCIEQTLRDYASENSVDVIVVSDAQRILGLGDLGANGMPIPVGKLLLYSACGGIHPDRTLPVVLDVGCNVSDVRDDPKYSGLRQPRVTGSEYDEFVNEFMHAAKKLYGSGCLIQFEDFGNANAARLLSEYRHDFLSFNDDIQGTAAVALAGILAALRIPGVHDNLKDHVFLFLGAGSAGIGIADLICLALTRKGMPLEEARKKCWFIDSKGVVHASRNAKLTTEKQRYAHADEDIPVALKSLLSTSSTTSTLDSIVDALKPTALIGVSTQPGVFDHDVFATMCKHNARPIVFALSNPTSKSECTAHDAYSLSDGKAVFASGSPFDPVHYKGQTFIPGQGNNCFIFPGLGLGAVLSQARVVNDEMILAAAQCLADEVQEDRLLDHGCVYPDIDDLLDISTRIAQRVIQEAKHTGVANIHKDWTVEQIKDKMYEPGRHVAGYKMPMTNE